jgi:ABC-type nitrate/sulfonate/bicarbonate transport system substrate-binding protein
LKNEDVTLKNIAGSDGRFACLSSGDCAAATLDQPAIFKALDAGHHALGITNEIGPRLYQLDIVNPTWAAAHRDTVVKYIRATTAAMRFIQDPKNRDEVVKVTIAFTKEPENHSRQMLANIWDSKNRVFEGAAPDMNAVKAAISLLGEYDVLKPPLPAAERFVDPSYSKAAQ